MYLKPNFIMKALMLLSTAESFVLVEDSECTKEDGRNGVCKQEDDCWELSGSSSARRKSRRFSCHNQNMVCCPFGRRRSSAFKVAYKKHLSHNEPSSATSKPPDPNSGCCGKEVGVANRIIETNCQTPNGDGGSCIIVDQCEPLRKLLLTRPSPQESDFLKRSVCGYQGNIPKVCCPVQKQPLSSNCFTPDGQTGNCISVYQCVPMQQLLSVKPVPQEALDYLRKSKCNGPDHFSVCCASSIPTLGPTPEPSLGTDFSSSSCPPSATLPDPNGGCCGVESVGGNRIFGGNATAIDQYPWMALIEYRQQARLRTLCGGSLISSKYVLTAGHCVAGDYLKIGNPVSVRLGEYDTSTETDCVPADGGGEDCSEPPVSIPIDRTILHPQYDPYAKRNDIALIRLRTLAPYTDFIRPICIPASDITLSPPAEFKLRVAGWGATEVKSSSNKKLHVELPYQPLSDCQKLYSIHRRNIPLWTKQVCAGGVKGKDSCKGDSGGPLMYKRGSTYEIIGVVNFGSTPCGLENVPGVYSKVYEYRDWIRSEVRP